MEKRTRIIIIILGIILIVNGALAFNASSKQDVNNKTLLTITSIVTVLFGILFILPAIFYKRL